MDINSPDSQLSEGFASRVSSAVEDSSSGMAETLSQGSPAAQAGHIDRAVIFGRDGRWLAGWALRFIVLAIAAYIGWIALAKVWTGLLPILLAILVCTVLWPPVRWLRNHKFPAALASAVVIVAAFGIFGGIIAAISPRVAGQSKELYDKAYAGIFQLQDWISGPPLNIQTDQVNEVVDSVVAKLQTQGGNIASGVFSGLSTASSVGVTMGITLVLTFFFLKDGDRFLPWVRKTTGATVGWHLTEVLTRTWNTLAGFIRAQAIVSLIDAVFIGIGLVFLGVPLAMVLAIITFFAGFIPIVGAVSAGAISVLVALVSNGLQTAIFVLILILVVQQLEGNVLSPILQSKAMDLHPVIVLLSVTIGGGLFGIVGAFLAVPVAAAVAVWLRYHADMISLRSGEITTDDIELVTAEESKQGRRSGKAAVEGLMRGISRFRPGTKEAEKYATGSSFSSPDEEEDKDDKKEEEQATGGSTGRS